MSERILVLGADNRQSAAIVRSLARAGFEPVAGREGTRRSFIERSRYVRRIWVHPNPGETEAFGRALLVGLESGEFQTIVPVGETQLRALASRRDLPADRVLAPAPETLARCLDKTEAANMASAAGIPVPSQAVALSVAESRQAAKRIGFPCVIKPASSNTEFLGRKALICRDEASIARELGEWQGHRAALIVQRFVPGRRHNCNVLAHDGRLTHYCEVAVDRTDRPDDSGYCVDGVTVPPTPELLGACTRLLASLRYSGPAGIQFLVDPVTRRHAFLEINPRFDAGVALPCHAGCDLPRLAIEQLRTPPAKSAAPQHLYRTGLRAHWVSGDVAGLVRAVKHGDLTAPAAAQWAARTLRSLARARCHVVGDPRDPWPALVLGWRLLRAALTR